ncbi:MAG TPA: NAD-dependent epimerase/dehydratase family protein [Crinalium sp.]|jgi:nucleoside-diphosphate-sugar epimerase
MKILVIGGTLFIGPPTVRYLCELGHEVTVFNRGSTQADLPDGVKYLKGDRTHLSDFRDDVQRLAPDVVLDTVLYTEAHAKALMETFRNVAQRVVVISSMDVYRAYDVILGKEANPIPVPITEESPLRTHLYPFRDMPDRPIAVPPDYDKILVERVVMSDPQLPGTVIRLPMVYGPHDPLHRLHPYLKRMDDHRSAILMEAKLANWRGSYGYVENIAWAIALATTHPQAAGRIYHVADAAVQTEAERVRHVGAIAGWSGTVVPVSPNALPADWHLPYNTTQDWFVDSTRIRQELGFQEVISPDEALLRTIDWERHHPPAINLEQYNPSGLLDYAAEDAILANLTQSLLPQ